MDGVKCRICSRQLNQANDPLSVDCGGDCWSCVSEFESGTNGKTGFGPKAHECKDRCQYGIDVGVTATCKHMCIHAKPDVEVTGWIIPGEQVNRPGWYWDMVDLKMIKVCEYGEGLMWDNHGKPDRFYIGPIIGPKKVIS